VSARRSVAGAKVSATVVAHGRGEKVRIFKMRRRKHFQKSQGHRQGYTEVRIDDIRGNGMAHKKQAEVRATAGIPSPSGWA
jgi:hypothetical protein